MKLRVVLAEDHEAVRDGLRLLFETRGDMDVVHGVPNGAEAIDGYLQSKSVWINIGAGGGNPFVMKTAS